MKVIALSSAIPVVSSRLDLPAQQSKFAARAFPAAGEPINNAAFSVLCLPDVLTGALHIA
ncbi:hypothetical protein D3C81_1391320 [compost metagenome]